MPQIGGKPDCGALFFLYFFSGAAGCSFKIFALVSLFSGPEGLAAERRFPYLDNLETIGGIKVHFLALLSHFFAFSFFKIFSR